MVESTATEFKMTEDERLDVCEAIHGKLTRAFNSFFWDADRKKLIDIRSGENLIGFLDYSDTYGRYSYLTTQYVKIMKKAVAIKGPDGIFTLYNSKCDPCARIDKDIPANYIKEYVASRDKLAIYLLGRKSVVTGMTVAVVNTETYKLEGFYSNVTRIFESEDVLKVVLLEDGQLVANRYNL